MLNQAALLGSVARFPFSAAAGRILIATAATQRRPCKKKEHIIRYEGGSGVYFACACGIAFQVASIYSILYCTILTSPEY